MMKTLVFCMLLLTFGAAFDLYHANRGLGMGQDGDDNYNEENYDDQDLGQYLPNYREDIAQMKTRLTLLKLMKSIQNLENAPLAMPYRPHHSIMKNPLAGFDHAAGSELMDLHGAVVKRHAGNTNNKVKPEIPKPAKDDVKIVAKGHVDDDVRL